MKKIQVARVEGLAVQAALAEQIAVAELQNLQMQRAAVVVPRGRPATAERIVNVERQVALNLKSANATGLRDQDVTARPVNVRQRQNLRTR